MIVTGYKIREAVRRWTTLQAVSAKMFPETIYAFDGDIKDTPLEMDGAFWKASLAIAELQEAQQRYNASVVVKVGNEEMTLSKAIKLVAFAGQRSKQWRTAASETGRNRFHERVLTRSKEDEVARRQCTIKDCLSEQERIDRYLSDLRTAIAVGNGQEKEVVVNKDLI